jgi:serine/threonine protein kinase
MNKNDIINAVNNLDTFLKVKALNGAVVKKKTNGQPFFFTGGFTMVFQLEKQSKKWAFRVWHTNIHNIKERFQKISKYLTTQNLPYFAEFIYDEKGLLITGELVDTIRMEWINGLLLKDYIEQNLQNKQNLEQLAESFLTMCEDLHRHKISHGDLQHGNIIIDSNDKIRLIDYDSICVPDIEGQEEFVTGLIGYQHLSRVGSNNKASLKADYFSELIIYLSIRAIAEKPELWDNYQIKDSEVLLFNGEDFANFNQSKIYNELSNGFSDDVKDLLNILIDYLSKTSYLKLEPVGSYLTPPEIIQFSVDKEVIISGQKGRLSWNVVNARSIEINNGIGKVSKKGSISICPSQNTIYKLSASGHAGNVEQEISVKIFPTPIIESIFVPMPDFKSGINLNPIQISSPKIDVSINMPDFNFNLPQFTEPDIDLQKIKPKYNSEVSKFNFTKIYEYVRRKSRS